MVRALIISAIAVLAFIVGVVGFNGSTGLVKVTSSDLGVVAAGTHDCIVTVENGTNSDVRIVAADPTCKCVAAIPEMPIIVAAGSSFDLNLKMLLDDSVGVVRQSLRLTVVNAMGVESHHIAKLDAYVEASRQPAFQQKDYWIGEFGGWESLTFRLQVDNNGSLPLNLVEAKVPEGVSIEAKATKDQSAFDVFVEIGPRLFSGKFQIPLELVFDQGKVSTNLSGVQHGEAYVDSPGLVFDSGRSRTLVVRHNPEVNVKSWQAEGDVLLTSIKELSSDAAEVQCEVVDRKIAKGVFSLNAKDKVLFSLPFVVRQ